MFAGAITAYATGATGAGVKIAIIDSGIDQQSAEFAGRIDPASRDIAGSRGFDDGDGHGTSVAAVALAAKNDSEIHGVAFNASVIALRTDTPGSCAATDGCSHADNNIAAAIDVAVSAGARVINMSLGGSAANTRLRNAIAAATAAGIIVVISAGNEGETATGGNPDPLAQIARDNAVARGRVLIAGGVDLAGQIADFSNRAGNSGQHYLAALAKDVRSFDHRGVAFIFGGTSYAAPSLSGAVALLAQAFPNLSADQIIAILFDSARDAGVAGIDDVYGRGILDLNRAFSPQGGTSLAGTAIPVQQQPGSVAVLGGALGDGGQFGAALGGVVILDRFDRAFVADLGSRIQRAAPVPKLAAALVIDTVEAVDAFGRGSYGLSLNAAHSRRPWVGLAQTGVDAGVSADARLRRGYVTGTVSRTSALGFAAGYGADELLAHMQGGGRGVRFIAGNDVLRDDGLAMRGTSATAMTQDVGAWRLGIAAGEGEATPLTNDMRRRDNIVTQFAASAARRVGAADLTFTYSHLDEAGTVLGAEGSTVLGIGGAASDFLGVEALAAFGGGWSVGGAVRGGRTRLALQEDGLVEAAAPLTSLGFAVDIAKTGVAARNDTLAFRVSQPLRVETGRVRLDVPVSFDYATLGVGFERRATSLSPSGREIDVEAAWSAPLTFGRIDGNLFWRRDPGHIDARADDLGAAVRLKAAF